MAFVFVSLTGMRRLLIFLVCKFSTLRFTYWSSMFFVCAVGQLLAVETEMVLRQNLAKAQPGHYIVTLQNKNYTLLCIRNKDDQSVYIDEITLPARYKPLENKHGWKKWVENGAPGHTSWVMYGINLAAGCVYKTFSFTKNEWVSIPQAQNFLSTLLNLRLKMIPEKERKKIGLPPASDSSDRRSIWQPQMIVEGELIKGVAFDAWRTRWPKDNSELAGKIIEVYLPKEKECYPTYFPYWLQVNGLIGKAKVRIIDSGNHLLLPTHQLPDSN